MAPIIQDNRAVKVFTALPDNTLLFSSMSGTEELSVLYNYQLTLVSEDAALALDDLLGTDVTIELELETGGQRYFHGYISQCSHVGSVGDFSQYEFSVRPWFWFLTRTSDCRIFQDMQIPDIIKQVFGDEGFSDFEDNLSGNYESWNYCVQYRETDYNFLSRLMEQEGIYYYFKHENGSHKLVLADSFSAHDTAPEYDEVPYYPGGDDQMRERDHLSRWSLHKQLHPGKFAINDFNFETPKADFLVKSEDPGKHARADYEIYDYPGEYPLRDIGQTTVHIRREEAHAQHEVADGSGNAQGLAAGNLFNLTNCEREDQNREYLITRCQCSLQLDDHTSGGGGAPDFYCDITAIDSKRPYRAPRVTPKPLVQGPQTAIVVGPSGEEIWTDKYGRVKLQFHWDRYGESDENSSCWIRVSQVHAGSGFGGIDIPRIGEEVIVEFLEGDPDRPIITGRVYNGDNKPPTGLPGAGMVSGMKTNSTPGGGGHNQITMNDTKGEESMDIHAQYDRNTTVLHDDTINVEANRTVNIKDNFVTHVSDGDMTHDVATGTAYIHIKGSVTEVFDDFQDTTVANDISVTSSAGKVYVKAATSIKLETGASSIEMDSGGNITIKGVNVAVKGSATVSIAGGQITSVAQTVHQTKGASVMSNGTAQNTVKGGVVLLNP